MADRHFVKYTFLKLDPAWRRLPETERSLHKQEFLAACDDFGTDHLIQGFSLVGTRGDCDLMIRSASRLLDPIHHAMMADRNQPHTCAEIMRSRFNDAGMFNRRNANCRSGRQCQ